MENSKPADTSPTSTVGTDEQSLKLSPVELIEPGTPKTDTSPTNIGQQPMAEDPQGIQVAREIVRKFMQSKYKQPPR